MLEAGKEVGSVSYNLLTFHYISMSFPGMFLGPFVCDGEEVDFNWIWNDCTVITAWLKRPKLLSSQIKNFSQTTLTHDQRHE